MIISTEAIVWFLMGKNIDDKTLFKLARLRNIEVEEGLRKNVSNLFLKKHVQSKTTIKNIKNFLIKLFNLSQSDDSSEQIDFISEIRLTGYKQNLEYIQAGYSTFFESAKLQDTFASHEINKIFRNLFNFYSLNDEFLSAEALDAIKLEDILFSQFDFKDDIYIELGNSEVMHKIFSLNLLLYLCACLDVNDGEKEASTFQLIFETVLSDINILKSPFYYFVLLFRDHYSKNGQELSFEQISEKLDIEPKSFSRYMKGLRNVHIKHLDLIIKYGNFMYFYISFWVHFLEKLSKTDEVKLLLTDSLNRYPYYYNMASQNFSEFKSR